MSTHKELAFEDEICEHLGSHGWIYVEGDSSRYDRALALFPDDVLAWLEETQAPAWESLMKSHGAKAGEVLLSRLRESMNLRGTLDVLRQRIEMLGVKGKLPLAQFKPALAINPEIQARYQQNRLRVVRQVRYSLHNENSIGFVLFLNGIPVATAELKTDFTQSVRDAIDQYRFDREPKPKNKTPETLLTWPNGGLVHFAVSNSDVAMVTRLSGAATGFLPFNKGDHGAAGNPVNPAGGHRTAYLREEVWQRESWPRLKIPGATLGGFRKNVMGRLAFRGRERLCFGSESAKGSRFRGVQEGSRVTERRGVWSAETAETRQSRGKLFDSQEQAR